MIRSRILREGQVLQVGNTELCLQCAPEGLAKRSRGLPAESDLVWCIRILGAKAWAALCWFGSPSGRRARFWRFLLVAFIAAAAAGYFRPGLLAEIRYYLALYWSRILEQVMMQIDQFL